MSQDSEEIKTTEQWKWSEMQGLELVSSDLPPPPPPPLDPFITNNPSAPTAKHTDPEDLRPKEEAQDGFGRATNGDMESTSDSKKENGGGTSGEKPEAVTAVGFGELFRFADGLDYVLMAIGSVGALVHGCSLPLFLRFFADLVNSFGSYANDVDKMMQEVLKVK